MADANYVVNKLNVLQPEVAAIKNNIQFLTQSIENLDLKVAEANDVLVRKIKYDKKNPLPNIISGKQGDVGQQGDKGIQGDRGKIGKTGLGNPVIKLVANEDMIAGTFVALNSSGKVLPYHINDEYMYISPVVPPMDIGEFQELIMVQPNLYLFIEQNNIGTATKHADTYNILSCIKLTRKFESFCVSYEQKTKVANVFLVEEKNLYHLSYKLVGAKLGFVKEQLLLSGTDVGNLSCCFVEDKCVLWYSYQEGSYYTLIKPNRMAIPIQWSTNIYKYLKFHQHINQVVLYGYNLSKKTIEASFIGVENNKVYVRDTNIIRYNVVDISGIICLKTGRINAVLIHSNNNSMETGYRFVHYLTVYKTGIQLDNIIIIKPKDVLKKFKLYGLWYDDVLFCMMTDGVKVLATLIRDGKVTRDEIHELCLDDGCDLIYSSDKKICSNNFEVMIQEPEVNNFIGILQKNVSSGELARVRVSPSIDETQKELIVGVKYYLDNSGKMVTGKTSVYVGIAVDKTKLLYSPKLLNE